MRYSYVPAGMKAATLTALCTSGTVGDCEPGNPAWDPISDGGLKLNYGANGRVAEQGALNESAGSAERSPRLGEVQHKLMAVVFSRTKELWRPAGELVDFLDAPEYFVENGALDPRVERALARIRRVCA